ncbi:hypothetical protein EsH8_VIII_000470 [Colletotrichum jinshuiense]
MSGNRQYQPAHLPTNVAGNFDEAAFDFEQFIAENKAQMEQPVHNETASNAQDDEQVEETIMDKEDLQVLTPPRPPAGNESAREEQSTEHAEGTDSAKPLFPNLRRRHHAQASGAQDPEDSMDDREDTETDSDQEDNRSNDTDNESFEDREDEPVVSGAKTPKTPRNARSRTPATPKGPRTIQYPTYEQAKKRAKQAFKTNPNPELHIEVRNWIEKFYESKESCKRPGITSVAYFRTVTDKIDKVRRAYLKGEPWTEYLPTHAQILGATFVEPPGNLNASIAGTLLMVGRLDLLTAAQLEYVHINPATHNVVKELDEKVDNVVQTTAAYEERIKTLETALQGALETVNKLSANLDTANANHMRLGNDIANKLIPKVDKNTVEINKVSTYVNDMQEAVREGFEKHKATITGIETTVSALGKKVGPAAALDKFKKGPFADLVAKVDDIAGKVGTSQAKRPAEPVEEEEVREPAPKRTRLSFV